MQKKVQVVECVKVMLNDPLFRDNHRTGSEFFTRNRKLTFVVVRNSEKTHYPSRHSGENGKIA